MNEDQTTFIQAVRSADTLPLAVREQAGAVQSCERRRFDTSYLDFLREQIALEARGPAWPALLKERLLALSPYCDVPLLTGTISTREGDYRIRVDSRSRQVIHCERIEPTENARP